MAVLPPGGTPAEFSDSRNDHRFYSFRRFCELAAGNNPNFLDVLFMPDDCVLLRKPAWECLEAHRSLFVSRRAADTYCGYAMAQIRRAKGCNKRVHNPQPVDPPAAGDFCHVIPRTAPGMPGRPVPLARSGIDLARCHVSAVENTAGLYRLYDCGEAGRGVFRDGNLVCESVPPEDEERRFIGYLLFNANGFAAAKKSHAQYWQWMKERNPVRWRAQEEGRVDYDTKNLMHTFRLLYSGIAILRTGAPVVRFTGERLAELKAIRAGEFPYGVLLRKAEELAGELHRLRDACPLPEAPDLAAINDLMFRAVALWEDGRAGRDS